MKNLKKNQVVIFVVALMLVAAGYLNYTNEHSLQNNLLPTSSLADSEQIAAIGDATLVNANEVKENVVETNSIQNEVQVNKENEQNISKDDYFTHSHLFYK